MRWSSLAVLVLFVALAPAPAQASETPVDPLRAMFEQQMGDPVELADDVARPAFEKLRADILAERSEHGGFTTFQVGAPAGSVATAPYAVAVLDVAIEFYGNTVTDIYLYGVCSGTVVSGDVVLTAGHCVEDGVSFFSPWWSSYDYLYTYIVVQGAPDIFAETLPPAAQLSIATQAAPLDAYSGDIPNSDVGAILLDEEDPIVLPSTTYPLVEGLQVPFIPADALMTKQAPLSLVSFGSDDPDGMGTKLGKIQSGKFDVIGVQECVDYFGDSLPTDHLLCTKARAPVQSACGGDSGGGFIQERFGRKVLVAVVSAGDSECGPGLPNLETRLGLAFAQQYGSILQDLEHGLYDDSTTLAGNVSAVEAQLLNGKVVLPIGQLKITSLTAALWRDSVGLRNIPITAHPLGVAIDLRWVAPGEPFTLEMPAFNADLSGPQVAVATGLLIAREPAVDVIFARDAAGLPVLRGTLTDQDGLPIAKHAVTVTPQGAGKAIKVTTAANGTFTVFLAGMPAGERVFRFTGLAVPTSLVAAFGQNETVDVVGRVPALTVATGWDRMGNPILTGRLADQDDAAIPKAKLSAVVTVAGKPKAFPATTLANGTFTVKLTGLTAGVHNVTYKLAPDAKAIVGGLNESGQLELVTRVPTANASWALVQGRSVLRGTLVDQDGVGMPGLPLQLTVAGKSLRATTLPGGNFAIALGARPAGAYEGQLTSVGNARLLAAPLNEPVEFTIG